MKNLSYKEYQKIMRINKIIATAKIVLIVVFVAMIIMASSGV